MQDVCKPNLHSFWWYLRICSSAKISKLAYLCGSIQQCTDTYWSNLQHWFMFCHTVALFSHLFQCPFGDLYRTNNWSKYNFDGPNRLILSYIFEYLKEGKVWSRVSPLWLGVASICTQEDMQKMLFYLKILQSKIVLPAQISAKQSFAGCCG